MIVFHNQPINQSVRCCVGQAQRERYLPVQVPSLHVLTRAAIRYATQDVLGTLQFSWPSDSGTWHLVYCEAIRILERVTGILEISGNAVKG